VSRLAQDVRYSKFHKTRRCSRGFAIRRVPSAALRSGVYVERVHLGVTTNHEKCTIKLHENGATVYRHKPNIVPDIIQQQEIQHTRSGMLLRGKPFQMDEVGEGKSLLVGLGI
jgi:hypothetical protein